MTHELTPDEVDPREDPLYVTIAKCSLAIKLAFSDAAIQMRQLEFPSGSGVTWGIFYPDGGPSAAVTILMSDLEKVAGDDAAIGGLVVERIGMAGDVLKSGVR